MDMYVGWPGSVHDARVFTNSDLYNLERIGSLTKKYLRGGWSWCSCSYPGWFSIPTNVLVIKAITLWNGKNSNWNVYGKLMGGGGTCSNHWMYMSTSFQLLCCSMLYCAQYLWDSWERLRQWVVRSRPSSTATRKLYDPHIMDDENGSDVKRFLCAIHEYSSTIAVLLRSTYIMCVYHIPVC